MTRRKRWGVAVAVAATVVVLVLLLSQLVLPSVAQTRIRESLEPWATDVTVSVEATPAVELLAGKADRVTIHADHLDTAGGSGVSQLLARASAASEVTATIGTMQTGPLVLRDVNFSKDGSAFTAAARLTDQALAAALPPGISVAVSSAGQNGLDLEIKPELLGASVRVEASVAAQEGKIVVSPNLPVLDAIHLSVFEDPDVDVEELSVRRENGAYVIAARGSYR